jgi:pimeloyl-ACP methyl ester carboxylesterase
VFGQGPLNVIFAPPSYSNVEHWWESPDATRWLLRLGSYARVVMFDKRGTGMSDRVADLAGLDQRMDDLRAVMEAADMEEAALLGMSEGGPMTMLFAATHPQQCRALVLCGCFARFATSWVPTEEQFLDYVEHAWGTGGSLPFSHQRAPTIRFFNAGGGGSSDLGRAQLPLKVSWT